MSELIEFTAKVLGDVGRRDAQIQRALQILQQAQRYSLNPHGDFYQGESMQSNDIGDWVEFDDVAKAIQILQGECEQ